MLPKPSWLNALARGRVLTIDCGAGHLACAEFDRGADRRLRLRQFDFETLDPNPAVGARWVDATGEALARIHQRSQLRGRSRITLPGHYTLTKFVIAPTVEPGREARIAEFEAQQCIPCPLEELVWDFQRVAEAGAEAELMLAAAKRSIVEPLCAAAALVGSPVEQIVPGPLALLRAFRHNYPDARAGALVLSIGARSTHLVLVTGERFFARTLAFGGNSVTQAVAEELHVEFATAEARKRRVLADDSADAPAAAEVVRRAADRFATRLHLEISRTIARRCFDGAVNSVATTYLFGGGALLPGLPEFLAEKLTTRVERFDPLRRIELVAEARNNAAEAGAILSPELVGLAVGPGPDEFAGFNLVPPEQVTARRIRRRQPYLLAAALLTVAAAAPVIWHFHRLVAVTEQDAAALEQELIPLRALVIRDAGNLARLEAVKARVAALGGTVDLKSSWMNFLADLQSRIVEVEDVWLDKLQVLPAPAAVATENAMDRPPLRVALSGRLLDWNNPISKVSTDSYGRAERLLASFGKSPFVAAVENERFDNSQPGLLRFDCVLLINPRHAL